MNPWIKQRDASKAYGISYHYLRGAINRGELTIQRGKPGRATLISRASLERWQKQRITLAAADKGLLV